MPSLKQLEDEEAKNLNKKRKKVTIISVEEDEEESKIEISPLNDQKKCFKCKTVFGKVKTNQNKWISCEKCNNWYCGKKGATRVFKRLKINNI
ncbi:hypothetical protein BpHYR1_052112 [Brachionus plicatilis]|uniref:Uncharacterized protein n=1 Tax=Brachionus plicatilis TaxID=10195 RepID=A0A3M7RPF6_BRAPC|nr:hypothetical protein BpHYR1_052112 [Brachionus plicatilis]